MFITAIGILVCIFCILSLQVYLTSAALGIQEQVVIEQNVWKFNELYKKAQDVFHSDPSQISDVIKLVSAALKFHSNDIDANQFLGTLYVEYGDLDKAAHYLRIAISQNGVVQYPIIANYIEVLRRQMKYDVATNVAQRTLQAIETLSPPPVTTSEFYFNYGFLESELGHHRQAADLYTKAALSNPSYKKAWQYAAQIMLDHITPAEAELLLEHAMKYHGQDPRITYLYGCSKHFAGKMDEAIQIYKYAEYLDPTYLPIKANIAAAYQGLGQVEPALHYYELVIPHMMNDAGVINNFGALLGVMQRKDDEMYWLQKALEIDPNSEHALVNLGGHYQDDGLLVEAAALLTRALVRSKSRTHLRLRISTMMSPISPSWEFMITERLTVERNLLLIIEQAENFTKNILDSNLDRIHFYIVYHGVSDRYLQEIFIKAYNASILDLNLISSRFENESSSLQLFHEEIRPVVNSSAVSCQVGDCDRNGNYWMQSPELFTPPIRKIRVAFISKFFGIFEPHGQLLDGIMKYLPRKQFFVIALPVARTDGKPLAPPIAESADLVQEISLVHRHAIDQITAIDIDILLFADVLCEPMNHYLAHTRLAKIQAAFWGNPITSGSAHMDYFISGESMEHPFRNRLPIEEDPYADPYTEQLVLMPGQGIWYFKPGKPEEEMIKANLDVAQRKMNATREEFELGDDWFVFFCPQSTFKIHPLFDRVFAEILNRVPTAHLVVTGGRKPAWTTVYQQRIADAVGEKNIGRFHVIGRVSSERFIALCKLADVILHPFPFDGSRTSADSLSAGIPYITLPTEYLRGRMGAAFYRTMNVPQLVARNFSEYVDIAVRLYREPEFLRHMKKLIVERVDLIWEDMESPFGWTQFFSTAAGLPSPSWEAFIAQTGRDVKRETDLRAIRLQNQRAFDETWGQETWLLQDGVAVIESRIDDPSIVPRIFNDWKSGLGNNSKMIIQSQKISLQERKQALLNRTTFIRPVPPFLQPGVNLSEIADIPLPLPVSIKSVPSSKFAKIPPVNFSIVDPKMDAFRDLIASGKLELAQELAVAELMPQYRSSPLFVLEYGALQVYRGNYNDGFQLCKQVTTMVANSRLAYACMGVAGTHLLDENATLSALQIAWQLSDPSLIDSDPLPSPVFSLTRKALDYNLLSALRTFKKFTVCANVLANMAQIVNPTLFEIMLIINFAFVDWSIGKRLKMKQYELILRQKGLIRLATDKNLFDEIIRVRSIIQHLLNPAIDCIQGLGEARPSFSQDISSALVDLLASPEAGYDPYRVPELMLEAYQQQVTNSHKQGLVLISQFFFPNSKEAQRDIDRALLNNLGNSMISDVVLLNEEELDFKAVPLEGREKIKQVVIGKRLTFADAFIFANKYYPNRTIILANADIYFDDSLVRLGDPKNLNLSNQVLALLKWRPNPQGNGLNLNLRSDSQDAWIFQSPISPSLLPYSQFFLGAARCDNRIAELLTLVGYRVINPAFAIHAIELQSGHRSGLYDLKGAAVGDGRDVLISDIYTF